eukprot:scaffold9338_cov113-Isochrysis_galbana.AAC.8
MIECIEVLHHTLITLTALYANGTLRDGRQHLIKLKHPGDVLLHAHATQAGVGEQGAVNDVLAKLLQPSLHVATKVDAFDARVASEQLRLPAQRGCADDRASWQIERRLAVGGDPGVARILAFKIAGQNGAGHKPVDKGRSQMVGMTTSGIGLMGES